ncbi:hypothetical protein HGRIS_001455 [Hohenbuehelia grisea]|uniref:Uncharacterized protein n=1 Tax=Hohenbuehelia grisea TaxID=104357 RepID=A0ABR3JPD0_9AGAR
MAMAGSTETASRRPSMSSHELTYGAPSFAANVLSCSESSASYESISDIFGSKQTAADADYLTGERLLSRPASAASLFFR